jgi:hypothetical protein
MKMVNVTVELAKNLMKVIKNNGNLVLLYYDTTSGDIIFRSNGIEENISINLFDVIKRGHYFEFIKMWNR